MKVEESSLPAEALPLDADKLCRKPERPWRFIGASVFGVLLVALFLPVLIPLASYAADTELHSHILLIPFVSAYLIYLKGRELPRMLETSIGGMMIPFALATISLTVASEFRADLSPNDYFAMMAFSLVCFVWAGGFLFLGRRWMCAAAFPMAFLMFFIPLPDGLVDVLERGLMTASAEAAELFFNLAGTPHLREGLVFQLPNIVIQVAQECSGIRSSWVLFITGTVASYLFLRSPWRRTAFVGLILPLGVLRNGFRIFVIGLLCVEIGPHMIHSTIHKRGGPLFFALSLIPLFVLLWGLRRMEQRCPLTEKPGKSQDFRTK